MTFARFSSKLPRFVIIVCIVTLLVYCAFTFSSIEALDAYATRITSKEPSNQQVREEQNHQNEQKVISDALHETSVVSQPHRLPSVPGTIPGIPGKVWHKARINKFTNDEKAVIGSWMQKNPNFRYELLTDDQAENYVISRFNDSRPDIVALYTALPVPILRADLLRYLILLSEGGIWSDLDVTCEVDVGHWLPAEMYTDSLDVSVIAGLEFDIPSTEGGPVRSQLASWVIAARKGSQHIQYVVDSVVEGLYNIAKENNVEPSKMTLDMISDVVDVTGPKKMTLGITESLSQMLGRRVDDRDIAGIKKPHLVGDVMIMPGAAFAASQNGHPKDQGKTLVTHHYAGSWKAEADKARARRKKLQEDREKGEELKS